MKTVKNQLVFSKAALPTRLPFTEGITIYLLLDKIHLPLWLVGIIWFCYGLWLILAIGRKILEKYINPLQRSKFTIQENVELALDAIDMDNTKEVPGKSF